MDDDAVLWPIVLEAVCQHAGSQELRDRILAMISEELVRHALRDVEVWRWQVNYDLALARKEGARATTGRGGVALEALLRCPSCGGGLAAGAASLSCGRACGRTFSVSEGMVALADGG